jgi:quercetin dioxygenase-like cupin family protein
MERFPFDEASLSGGQRVRTFSGDVDVEELVWHRDAEDRSARVIVSEGWYIQFDGELPKEMKPGDVFFIPKETWHRVIRKGDSLLAVEIVTTEGQNS